VERLLWKVRSPLMAEPSRAVVKFSIEEPLIVAGFLKTASGLGEAARGCLSALNLAGLNPISIDLSETFNQVDLEYPADLTKLPWHRAGTVILFANGPEVERALFSLGLHRGRGWRVIGAWAWELDVLPAEWLSSVRFLSEIWTPSEFVSKVFRSHVSIPVSTVPHFVSPPVLGAGGSLDLPIESTGRDETAFLVMADGRSSFGRKNVSGAIGLFRDAFENRSDVRLRIKTRNLGEYATFQRTLHELAAADSRIEIIDQSLSEKGKWQLLLNSDIVLSPHRSEGFGLHLAEAMSIGRSVVATGWSGNTEFMRADNSTLLEYELKPATDSFNVYNPPEGASWAHVKQRPSIEVLRDLVDNPERRRKLEHAASRFVSEHLNENNYVKALKEIPNGVGLIHPNQIADLILETISL